MKTFAKKSFLSLGLVLAGGLMLTSPAHAFLIDGFGDDQGPVNADGSSGSLTVGPDAITDTDFVNAQRSLTVERTGGAGDITNDVEMKVNSGSLQYSQDTQTLGIGTVDWTGFETVSFGTSTAILISVIEADNANGGITITLGSSSESDSDSVTIDLPTVTGGPETIVADVSGFSAGLLASVDSASLEIDGREVSALDVSIDFIEVPAPGVLGLLGLGLFGLAFVGRRRAGAEVDA